jgi:CHASE3 domain sensor protein
LKRQGNSLVEVLNEYQEGKEKFTQVMDDVHRLNEEERSQNKALWDIFEERWSAMEQRMTSLRDQNILVSSDIFERLNGRLIYPIAQHSG